MKSTFEIRVGLLAYGAIGEGSTVELSLMEAKFALTTVRATSRSVAAFKEYLEVSRIN